MELTVNVTDSDIANGVASDCRECPIALAIGRLLSSSIVSVGYNTISVEIKGKFYYGNLPDKATRFIFMFDKGQQVSPFTFSLALKSRM